MASFTVDLGSGPVEGHVGIETLVAYEQEFGRDMVKDLYGKAELRDEGKDADVVFSFDYRSVNWTAAVRCLWACLRAKSEADRALGKEAGSVPPFSEWARSVGDVDLFAVAGAVTPAVQAGLFRPAASRKGGGKARG